MPQAFVIVGRQVAKQKRVNHQQRVYTLFVFGLVVSDKPCQIKKMPTGLKTK